MGPFAAHLTPESWGIMCSFFTILFIFLPRPPPRLSFILCLSPSLNLAALCLGPPLPSGEREPSRLADESVPRSTRGGRGPSANGTEVAVEPGIVSTHPH